MNRSRCFAVVVAIFLLLPTYVSADKAPKQIAGLVLGEQIATFVDLVRMETATPLRDRKYLREARIREIDGYRSGTVGFGNCNKPGQIVRIKLKYEYTDKNFYNELLDQFKKKFGEPDEWRGDPFHVIIAWKWSFTDEDNNKISLILQHSRDEDYKWGNSVKFTNTTLLEQEQNCYQKKHSGKSGSRKGKPSPKRKKLKAEDYQRFIPE
ncbi:MAG: hypothetical protein PVJ11_09090 [Syntrophobacterales bacterium]|jgi:hypothetical protein